MYLAAPLPLLFVFLAYLNACAARLMLPGIFVFLCDLLIFLRTVAHSDREMGSFSLFFIIYRNDLKEKNERSD
jgi:hypothetical protein